ncbi:hypothetical protein OTU49_012393 [Cherax quadricarinatus]|uniref:Uncharacterized protein n=1 Tax=Cherax quadricarinatus TaxID=27406 RepID=A0AAW0VZT0_CHEQU
MSKMMVMVTVSALCCVVLHLFLVQVYDYKWREREFLNREVYAREERNRKHLLDLSQNLCHTELYEPAIRCTRSSIPVFGPVIGILCLEYHIALLTISIKVLDAAYDENKYESHVMLSCGLLFITFLPMKFMLTKLLQLLRMICSSFLRRWSVRSAEENQQAEYTIQEEEHDRNEDHDKEEDHDRNEDLDKEEDHDRNEDHDKEEDSSWTDTDDALVDGSAIVTHPAHAKDPPGIEYIKWMKTFNSL